MRCLRNHLLVVGAISVLVAGAGAAAQNPEPQTSGLDITGAWYSGGASMEGGANTELVDYSGLPLSEAGRLYALAWDPSRWTSRQQQCMAYEPTRLLHGGGNFRFWEERDPHTQRLIAIKLYGQIREGTRTVWMDGRPHPPAYAKHTFLGFSTGKYEGNVLTVYTTHLKRNYIRTNGVAMSDQTTLVEHFIRHGDRTTYITVLTDPVYLTEPLIRNSDMRRSVRNPEAWLYACDDGEQILGRPDDQVPNYMFGQNPYLREHADKYHIPLVGALGGPETLYPDYKEKLASATEADAIARTRPLPNAPAIASRAVDPDPHDGEIHVWPVQGNVYILIGSFFSAGAQSFSDAGVGATIIAHNNVLNRMSAPTGQVAPTPSAGWPSDTYLQGRRRKHYNDEGVEILWQPSAVTDGDSIVHFRRSDVIVTGDLFTTTQYPFIDIKNGGSLQGLIAALNRILDRTIYKHQGEGGTLIIPGHGRVCDEFEVAEYRDMLVIIRDRVQALIKQGASSEQVQAARVTADFDSRFGAT